MAHFHNPSIIGASGSQSLPYSISRSLRFNSADSTYLSRTPGSAGNQQTWTLSMWVKRGKLGSTYRLFDAYTSTTDTGYTLLGFSNEDKLIISGWSNNWKITTQVFRDVSAWYHIVVAFDVTQATGSNRIKFYVNGTQITAFDTDVAPAQNTNHAVNGAIAHAIGRYSPGPSQYFDGYIADVYLLDGTATTPSTFAETDAITGQWVPKTPTGISYGTNGFRLTFSDNSGTTSTTLGKDAAGSNNWTPNNFSVASGSGNDSLVDSPTSYGTDTGAGGEVRGNFCTWNPLGTAGPASSNGNLDIASSSTAGNKIGTFLLTSGKWYWECSGDGYAGAVVGVGGEGFTGSMSSSGSKAIGYWFGGGIYWDGGSFTSGIASYTTTDVIGVAVDMTAGTVAFYKNNTLVYTATFGSGTVPNLSSGVYPGFNTGNPGGSARTVIANFGQRAFAYTAPSGYKALCDTNLTAPTIAKPANYFDAKLYTGNGSTQTISGLGFSPDFIWIKNRSSASNHHLVFDAIRGTSTLLYPSFTNSESTDPGKGVTSFGSNGFTVVDDTNGNSNVNGSVGGTYSGSAQFVAWAWDAASSNSTNTNGTITSTVRANATAGFSIVTYTGNGTSGATIGHSLGAAPAFVAVKRRDVADSWIVYHSSVGNTKYLLLNNTTAASTYSGTWNNAGPSSTTITLGNDVGVNANGGTYVAYCFAPVAGYSSFGSFVTNGADDNVFVYTGFRPRWIMWKRTDGANSWGMVDTARNTYNVVGNYLLANASDAEANSTLCDILSNGFKMRTSGFSNGQNYIYFAVAESPFQYARAR